ncbi:TPA: DUF551 domain-containing protein [Pasteurella multocida]
MTVTITKAEYESLLADKKRLDFIEKNWCEVIDGIPEIKITAHIIVGETQLRPALDQVINGYEKLNFHWEYNTWISVKDKLPKKFDRVLVCQQDYKWEQNYIRIAYCNNSEGTEWWADNYDGTGDEIIFNDVTHWQTLPPIPKEIEK